VRWRERLQRFTKDGMGADGFVQAPGAADGDLAGGFRREGRTYESFAAHWPNMPDEEQAPARPLVLAAEVGRVDNPDRAARVAALLLAAGRHGCGRLEKGGRCPYS